MTREECSQQLQQIYHDILDRHGAVDMIAEHDFVGFVREESAGYVVDVSIWGVQHTAACRGATIEEAKNACMSLFMRGENR